VTLTSSLYENNSKLPNFSDKIEDGLSIVEEKET